MFHKILSGLALTIIFKSYTNKVQNVHFLTFPTLLRLGPFFVTISWVNKKVKNKANSISEIKQAWAENPYCISARPTHPYRDLSIFGQTRLLGARPLEIWTQSDFLFEHLWMWQSPKSEQEATFAPSVTFFGHSQLLIRDIQIETIRMIIMVVKCITNVSKFDWLIIMT